MKQHCCLMYMSSAEWVFLSVKQFSELILHMGYGSHSYDVEVASSSSVGANGLVKMSLFGIPWEKELTDNCLIEICTSGG